MNLIVNVSDYFVQDEAVNKSVKLNDANYLLFGLDNPNCPNRNVVKVNSVGKIEWIIEESPHGGGCEKPFVDLYLSESKNLIVCNWIGVDYKLNHTDGTISPVSFNRF